MTNLEDPINLGAAEPIASDDNERAERAHFADVSYAAPLFLTEGRVQLWLIALPVLVYANSLGGPFIFDDLQVIVGNPQLHSWDNLLRAFTSDVWDFRAQLGSQETTPPYYRPMHTIYMTVCYKAFGLWPQGWHLASVTVHVLATLAAYRVVRHLSGNWQVAAVAALLFSLNPARVESVAWISGITDPLMTVFYLPALLFYIYYRERAQRKWLVLSVALYALACLSKEAGLTLPGCIIVWEAVQWRHHEKRQLRALRDAALRLLPYAVVTTTYLIARYRVLGSISGVGKSQLEAWLTLPYVMLRYVQHQIAPIKLSIIYNITFVNGLTERRVLVPLLLLFLTLAALCHWRRRIPAALWMALALIIVPLSPALNLRLFGDGYLLQDRYFYISAIGLCWLVATLAVVTARRYRIATTAVTGAFIIALGASTMAQNRIWSDSRLLWLRGVEQAPLMPGTYMNLGLAYAEHSDYLLAHNAFLKALALEKDEKDRAKLYSNYSVTLTNLGQTNEAIAAAQRAIEINPQLLEAHNNLGLFYAQGGDYHKAHEQLRHALEIEPRYALARSNFAQAKASLGDYKGAVPHFETVLRQQPGDMVLRYKLALSYIGADEPEKAIVELERCIAAEKIPEVAAMLRGRINSLRKVVKL